MSRRAVRNRCNHRGNRDGRPSGQGFPGQGGFEHHGRVRLPGQGSCRRFCERRFDRRHDGRFDVCRQTDRGCGASHDFIHRSHHRRASCAAAGRGPECGLQARGAGAVRPDRLDLRRGGAGHRASARGGAQHRRGACSACRATTARTSSSRGKTWTTRWARTRS